ncbi:hypothetical protein KRX57_05605 [Weeksellaceae bacterium TAE3-ERU29]|nr:hypothetical protein [Weeksellaceae bacterium TAE3-ERU29]
MKKQFYKLSTMLFLGLGAMVSAQVGINEDAPKATLDVTAKTATGNDLEGILIPRVTTQKAEDMGANNQIQESTLIYISDDTAASTDTYTAEVDAKGFYYFADNKWNKVGGGASGASLETITGGIRVVDAITLTEWAKPNTFALVQTTDADIKLPAPSAYKNKIISVNNQYTTTVNYTNPAPVNKSSLYSGFGHLLMSDGTNWYIIGGSY